MRTDVHKLAVNNFLRPDAPVSIVLQGSIDDDRLLAGSVPQPSDWLRAWKICGNPQSWAAAAADADLENYVHQLRARGVPSRGIEKMVEVMHEVVRMPKRQWLRDCMSIWLSFDDRAGFKLMRFSCDALDAPLGSRQGVLGCVNILEGITLEELDEDYAKRVASEVERMIRRFCTPLGDDMDVALFNKICRATRGLVTDKALLKATHVLKLDFMPNVVLLHRDPAHAIRLACQGPVQRTGTFEAQSRRLFTDKHAFFKDLQYSDLWQQRLQDCQRLVIHRRGSQIGVKHIMRHFSFAPQRWESDADPRRKYICCLNAVALLLCHVASDARQTRATRDRAKDSLRAMTPRDIMETGLTGDFQEECIRLPVTARAPSYVAECMRNLARLFMSLAMRSPSAASTCLW